MRQRSSLSFILPVALLLVSGCSDSAITPAHPGATGTPQMQPGDTVDTPDVNVTVVQTTSHDSAGSDQTVDVDTSTFLPDQIDRKTLTAMATTTNGCVSGIVTVNKPGTILAITADCDRVDITASGVIVVAQAVTDLRIDASGVVVLAKDLDFVEVTSNSAGTLVQWEEGSPSIDDQSTGSVIRPLN